MLLGAVIPGWQRRAAADKEEETSPRGASDSCGGREEEERERERALPHLRRRRLWLRVRPSPRRSGFLRLKASAVEEKKNPPLYRVQIKQLHYSSPPRYAAEVPQQICK